MSFVESVSRLTITFLVDNAIEWMTKLPPGFSHELPQHLQLYPRLDEVIGVPVIDLDDFCCGAHGFSALIETEHEGLSYFTLFDTGPDSQSLARNLSSLKIPVEKIELVIISHWHRDHTGGLLSFLNTRQSNPHTNSRCTVDIHPDRPFARGIAPGPTYDKVLCALPSDPPLELIENAGGVLAKHSEGHAAAGKTIWVSGEIPRITEFETGLLGGMRWYEDKAGWAKEQHIMDERYAVIEVAGKGLVIFSACSHAGIVNVIKDVIAIFRRPIYMIIGGLHLAGPEFAPRLGPTVKFLSEQLKPSPTYILPMHCSGFQAKIALEAAFGEGCVPAGAGHKVTIVGNHGDENHQYATIVPTLF